MYRWLLCLPFLLFFLLLYPRSANQVVQSPPQPKKVVAAPTEWLSALSVVPSAGFPAALPWLGLHVASQAKPSEPEPLPETDFIVWMEKCIARYNREITGYKGILRKREKNRPVEIIRFAFREKPHSIHMKWLKGQGAASEVLYVQGSNDNKIIAKLNIFGFTRIIEKSLDDPHVQSNGSVPINRFGMKYGMRRGLRAWKAHKAKGCFHIEYQGLYRLPEAGNRLCYKIHRSGYFKEETREAQADLYFDKENWLQVGSLLRDADGNLVAEYYFSNLELNPDYPADYFDRRSLEGS